MYGPLAQPALLAPRSYGGVDHRQVSLARDIVCVKQGSPTHVGKLKSAQLAVVVTGSKCSNLYSAMNMYDVDLLVPSLF